MSSSITIKRHNHWFYHCEPSRKQEMLAQLLSDYAQKSVLIAVSERQNFSLEDSAENITVMTDEEIKTADAQQFDLIIHADLPVKALHYIKRLSCAKELSIGILIAEEIKLLYPIETFLGRNIMQKYLEGFEPVQTVQEEFSKRTDHASRYRSERDQKPRHDKKKFGKSTDPAKRRQRNHHKDGTVRTEEERAEYQLRRTKSGMKRKSYNDRKSSDEKDDKKPFGDKKKYDREERSDNGYKNKKPFNKESKRYDSNGKKPFDKRRDDDTRKNDRSFDKKAEKPKRKPRNFKVKTLKKDEDK